MKKENEIIEQGAEQLELLEKHKNLVKIISRGFKNYGVNEQDLIQEGLIALFKAAQTFNKDTNAKFETYASHVIKNRLIDVVRREKEISESLSERLTSGETIEDEYSIIEKSETIKKILDSECTEIEKAIFKSYVRGHSYNEIAAIFGITNKKIDNTIQKVRNKIRGKL